MAGRKWGPAAMSGGPEASEARLDVPQPSDRTSACDRTRLRQPSALVRRRLKALQPAQSGLER
eukprot:9457041-Alexandrium_andersonii.AAC.1